MHWTVADAIADATTALVVLTAKHPAERMRLCISFTAGSPPWLQSSWQDLGY